MAERSCLSCAEGKKMDKFLRAGEAPCLCAVYYCCDCHKAMADVFLKVPSRTMDGLSCLQCKAVLPHAAARKLLGSDIFQRVLTARTEQALMRSAARELSRCHNCAAVFLIDHDSTCDVDNDDNDGDRASDDGSATPPTSSWFRRWRSGRRREAGTMACPECHIDLCRGCGDPPHLDRPCTGEGNTMALFDAFRTENCKPCPSCSAPVEKTGGCSHMHCTICGTDFCWECVQAYDGAPHQCPMVVSIFRHAELQRLEVAPLAPAAPQPAGVPIRPRTAAISAAVGLIVAILGRKLLVVLGMWDATKWLAGGALRLVPRIGMALVRGLVAGAAAVGPPFLRVVGTVLLVLLRAFAAVAGFAGRAVLPALRFFPSWAMAVLSSSSDFELAGGVYVGRLTVGVVLLAAAALVVSLGVDSLRKASHSARKRRAASQRRRGLWRS